MGGLNVTARFHRREDAEAARRRLVESGIAEGAVRIADPSVRDDPSSDASATRSLPSPLRMKDAIARDGVDGGDPQMGGILVIAEVDDRDHDRVLDLLHADGAAVQDLTRPRRGTPADEWSVRSPDYDDGERDRADP